MELLGWLTCTLFNKELTLSDSHHGMQLWSKYYFVKRILIPSTIAGQTEVNQKCLCTFAVLRNVCIYTYSLCH